MEAAKAAAIDEQVPLKKGMAPIKKEYIVLAKGKVINWDFVTDAEKTKADGDSNKRERVDDRDSNPSKKFKLKGQNKSKLRYQLGKKKYKNNRQNDPDDADRPPRRDKSTRLCLRYMEREGHCPYVTSCEYSHDLHKIYKTYEEDMFAADQPCYIYSTYGKCQFGPTCLYAKSHTYVHDGNQQVYNMINHKTWSLEGGRENFIERIGNKLDQSIQHKLRKRTYDFSIVTKAMNTLYKADADLGKNEDEAAGESKVDEQPAIEHNDIKSKIGAILVDEFTKGRDYSRKRIDFSNKLCLAPLTTVGNLPFRRLCKKLSCDITCAEMSLSTSMLNANPSEWSHVKRHESEDIFGVQITGTHPEHTTKVVKVLNDTCDLDFVDFNCGCPTDWIYSSGAGSGLMNRPSKLRKMIAGACMVSRVPITIKMRTGSVEEKNTAHNLINSVIRPFTNKYIGAVTIHGRSRAARYTKLADWHYINECRRFSGDIPIIGSGDCISWQDYYEKLTNYDGVSCVMLARGALIAPWLFTEIRERRTWDISSRERLDIIRDYANYALDHWGSDPTGVENSRRYLLEWLSFACRYIPVGLLEVLPQKINERPPKYRGRDELETLLSSPSASDWVRISEMFLGKVSNDFKFLPKHKANAYDNPDRDEAVAEN